MERPVEMPRCTLDSGEDNKAASNASDGQLVRSAVLQPLEKHAEVQRPVFAEQLRRTLQPLPPEAEELR